MQEICHRNADESPKKSNETFPEAEAKKKEMEIGQPEVPLNKQIIHDEVLRFRRRTNETEGGNHGNHFQESGSGRIGILI